MPITGKELSLYFHVPFCKKKCPYCHFYSIFYKEELEKLYLDAIKEHLNIYQNFIKKNNLISIYFGGGTPSLLKIKTLEEILTFFNISKNTEITIEINPEDISNDKIKAYKSLNINRASIGVQSFNDSLLKILNRRHIAQKAKDVINSFYKNGIENISIDLMYDIMKQDLSSWKKNLNEIKNLPITHISLYNLTFEKNTLFYKNKEKLLNLLPKEKESLALLEYAVSELEKLNFNRYEISAFAKKGHQSIHNRGYWIGREFLGLGPSAFSYLNKKRFQNIKNLKIYAISLKKNLPFIGFEEKLKYPQNIKELLAVNLRLLEGINIEEFQNKFGEIPSSTIKILKNSNFVNFENNKVKLNKKGLLFYDTLASEII